MAEDTYYFSHDYNVRTDKKIKKLLFKWGMLGYGVYWAIVEDLYNNANALGTHYDAIAYDLRVEVEMVKSIINDFELFVIDGEIFGSLSVQSRLEKRDTKKRIGSESAHKRWNKNKPNGNNQNTDKVPNANPMGTQKEPNAIKERKGKDNKVKENKEKETKKEVSSQSSLFTSCIDVYNKFCLKITSVKADIDSLQGKSMNGIIEYLQKNVHDKDGGDDAILSAWVFILDEYKNWEKFHKENIKLNQIRTNLVNIIAAIKRNHKPTEQENIKNRRAELLKDEPDGKPKAATT